ncbi:synaptotagmin-like protein 2 isoform X18 [Melanotaenia boesemani]|nr:synaptotagmin-like protein 2 isoform X18 [Melanotaenia boesemani]
MSISSSKSLENLTSQTAASTITNLKPMKPSLSVPLLQQNETDSTFETNLGHKRNNSSSMSNMTLSSGMASMSSISSSVSSLHPPDCGDVDIQGSIQFAVNYIQKLGEFHIFVVLVRGLAVADTKKNRSDPYVKCYLLPDKTKLGKRKTTVKKRTLNPTYNEVLRFKIKLEELKTQKLNISVWHNDTFGRNSFLGEVDLDLFQWDFSNTQINEYTLKARVSEPASAPAPSHIVEERGQMRVALRFLLQTPNSKGASRMETGEVQIWVKDCKNLPPVGGIIINPFVKCTVLPDMSFKSRQKTRVVKRTASPMFNHIMVYDGFRSEDLKEACVEITVWDHDRLKNQYVGGLRLGLGTGKSYGVDVFWMDSTRNETDLWQRMLQSDGEWVEDVLPLRMIVTAKSMSK